MNTCKNCGKEFIPKLYCGKWQTCCSKRCAFGWAGKQANINAKLRMAENDAKIAPDAIAMFQRRLSPKEIGRELGSNGPKIKRILVKAGAFEVRVRRQHQKGNTSHVRPRVYSEKEIINQIGADILEQYKSDDTLLRRMDDYWLKHPDAARHIRNQRAYRRAKGDVGVRIKRALRCRVWKFTNGCGKTKSANTMTLVGCSREQFIKHLESKFTDGMGWHNYGGRTVDGWEIDHIVPCASFDLSKPEDQHRCFHYSNTQPMWKADNIRKGDSMHWQTPVTTASAWSAAMATHTGSSNLYKNKQFLLNLI